MRTKRKTASKDNFIQSLPSDIRKFLKTRSFKSYLKLNNVKAKTMSIYTNEFFSYLDNDFLKIPLVTPRVCPTFDEKELILSNFKEFQKSKNVKFLGRAISIYPYLLEQDLIRLKVESIILAKKNNKRYKNENLDLFLEGLEYKHVIREFALSDYGIKFIFEIIYSFLSALFDEYKPRTDEDRANVIRKLFAEKKVLFLEKLCEDWAEAKEPRRIALHIVQFIEAYHRDDSDSKTIFNLPHRIGFNQLNKIVAKKTRFKI